MLSLAYFLAFVFAASAIPSPEIVRNSERLALGLPPLPPKFVRSLPGRASSIDGPTPAFTAKRSSTSAAPVSHSGRIEVRNGDSVLGYVENSSRFGGNINLTGDKDADLHVTIHTTSTGTGLFDITAVHPQWKGPPYLGAGSSRPSLELNVGSENTIGFVPLKRTPPNSPPVVVDEGLTGESRIWSINPHTMEIRAHWINPDGTKPATMIAYDIKENALFFVGDIKAYNHAFSWKPASIVKFFLTP